tara:strand:- start:5275 stop:5808 length:534 start_codon:yes stop_codon:yes gene_type:complete
MKWLEIVAKHHKEHLEIVKNLGGGIYSEDVVQEFYLRLHKYGDKDKVINKEGIINGSYIYFSLRNTYLLFLREKNKIKKINIDEINNLGIEDEYISKTEALTTLENKINNEIKSWEWFDAKMFKVYRNENISYRELSNRSKISLRTIFSTLKRCKDKLRENIGEDYEDYINEDYEFL